MHIPFCLIHVSGFGISYFSLKNCYGALDTVQIDTEALADVTILPAVVSCFEGLTRIGGATGAPEPGLRGAFTLHLSFIFRMYLTLTISRTRIPHTKKRNGDIALSLLPSE